MSISDNFQRGDRALHALQAAEYNDPESTKGIELPTPTGEMVPGPEGYPISDLIADLCHLARRYDFDFMQLIEMGIKHYGSDCVEQAFHADEDWGPVLDERAQERATQVLRINGVPERYDLEIFVMVGILPPGSDR